MNPVIIPRAIALDPNGNIYATVSFRGEATFGTSTFTSTSTRLLEAALVKFSPTGTVLWAQQFSGDPQGNTSLNVDAYTLAVDAAGNPFIALGFGHDVHVGGQTYAVANNSVAVNSLVVKLDPNGGINWVFEGGASYVMRVQRIGFTAQGEVDIAGHSWGPLTLGPFSIAASGGNALFLARLTATGQPLWVREHNAGMNATSLFLTGFGQVPGGGYVVAGKTRGPTVFGTITLPLSSTNADIYVARFDSAGQAQWAQAVMGPSSETLSTSCLCVGPDGSSYLTGSYKQSLTFGPITLTTNDSSNAFIARFSPQGTPVWAINVGGVRNDYGTSIALGPRQTLYTSGVFATALPFGTTTLTPRGGPFDAYLGQLTGAGPLAAPHEEGPPTAFAVYPNPVEQGRSLSIVLPDALPKLARVTITDQLGRSVYTTSLKAGERRHELALPSLIPGLYTIQVAGTSWRKRLTVQ